MRYTDCVKFAGYMFSGPQFFDGRSILLLSGFGFVAFALSPACRWLNPRLKQRVLLVIPPIILLLWFLFQRELLLSGLRTSSFYRSMWGLSAWKLNSAIFIGFGIAFAVGIVRMNGIRHRIYGIICILSFLPLLAWFNVITPVSPNAGIRYRLDVWMHSPVKEPFADGKSLSYWANRVQDVADTSEPAVAAIRSMGTNGVNALIREFQTGEGYWTVGEQRPQPWSMRQHAAEALIKLGTNSAAAVPLMIDSLKSSDQNTRKQAVEVLGAAKDASPQVIKALIRSLEDEETAYYAMKSLARLAEVDPAIVNQLVVVAQGPRPKAAYWAMVTLSETGQATLPVLQDLIACVQLGPSESRQPAVQAIALIGTNAAQAEPALTAALKGSDEWTRKCIYIALGRIGPSASNALPVLRSALTNESYSPARMDVARALWRIDRAQLDLILPAIKQSLDEGDRQLQREKMLSLDYLSALDLIGEIGAGAASFVPRLQRCLESNDSDIQLNSAWSLWRVSPKDASASKTTLYRLIGLENYPLERIGPDEWGRALSDLKRRRESFHPRFAAFGMLWQMDESAKPELATALADLLRDWDFFTSMKHISPEEVAAVPLLSAIENGPAYVKLHEAARKAKWEILGNAGERW